MNNQIAQDLQLFGLDESVTAKELQMRWRQLSAHTHPDRFKKDTFKYSEAQARQKALNCAKDRLCAYIALRDAEGASKPSKDKDIDQDQFRVDLKNAPHIRTTERLRSQAEERTYFAPAFIDELSSIWMFVGAMFIGVAAAGLVAALLPALATATPLLLVAVMLTTMFWMLIKLKRQAEYLAQGVNRDDK